MTRTELARLAALEVRAAELQDLAAQERRRLESVEEVIAGLVTERRGLSASEPRMLVLSALKFGLILSAVFLAGAVTAALSQLFW